MTKKIDIINAAVALIVKAVILAASYSGRVRKRSLKRLVGMDVSEKDRELVFLRDKVDQLQMQVLVKSRKELSTHSNRYSSA